MGGGGGGGNFISDSERPERASAVVTLRQIPIPTKIKTPLKKKGRNDLILVL